VTAPDALNRRHRPTRAEVMTAAQLGVSLVALGAVVWWALRQEAPELPRSRADGLALVGALAVYALATAARAERWHRILLRAAVPAPRAESYRLTVVGYMGNNVLPARTGDVLRAFLLAPLTGVRKRQVLGTVVAERLLDVLALGLVFAVVAFGVVPELDVPGGGTTALFAVAAAAALVAGALVLVLAGRRGALGRVRSLAQPLAQPTRELASAHGVALLALSLLVWTLEATVYLGVARAVELDLDLVEALYVVALTNLFALVPAAPGYVGTFDAAVLFAVGSLGASGSEALAYLVLLRFVLFVPITVVGLGFFLARYGGWSRYRAAKLAS
jgi:glycosyltransferase 2 family protein